ncbi:hypothetical protein AAMO2058_000634800 [Amorphochlora amoebiformis]
MSLPGESWNGPKPPQGGVLWSKEELESARVSIKTLYGMSKMEEGRQELRKKGTPDMIVPIITLCAHACIKSHFQREANEDSIISKAGENEGGYREWMMVTVFALRTIRNLCVDSKQTQDNLIDRGIVQPVVALTEHGVERIGSASKEEEKAITKLQNQLVTATLQTLVNLSAGNIRAQDVVWKEAYPNIFQAFRPSVSYPPPLFDPLCGLLHTCLVDSEPRRKIISTDFKILAGILDRHYRTLLIFEGGKIPANPWVTSLEELQGVPWGRGMGWEWTAHTLNCLYPSEVFQNPPENSAESPENSAKSPENSQKIPGNSLASLLRYLLRSKENSQETAEHSEKIPEESRNLLAENDPRLGAFGVALVLSTAAKSGFGWEALNVVSGFLRTYRKNISLALDRKQGWSKAAVKDAEPIRPVSSIVFAVHASIRALTSALANKQPAYRDRVASGIPGLIPGLKNILSSISGSKKKGSELLYKESSFRMRSDLLNLFANFAAGSKATQDSIASKGGLETIMSQTYIDTNNPLQREYSVFALRNLCRNNPGIQKSISEIQFQEVANTSDLAEMGLRAAHKGGANGMEGKKSKIKLEFVKDTKIREEMVERQLLEIEALKAMYPDEMTILTLPSSQKRTPASFSLTLPIQDRNLIIDFSLPLTYPSSPPALKLRYLNSPRTSELEAVNQILKTEVKKRVSGEECLMELISFITTDLFPKRLVGSTVDGKQEGGEEKNLGWVGGRLVRIDHMNDAKGYQKLISKWIKQLGIYATLNYKQGPKRLQDIYLLLVGDVRSLKEFCRRLRSQNVDVNSQGVGCKERFSQVVWESDKVNEGEFMLGEQNCGKLNIHEYRSIQDLKMRLPPLLRHLALD